MTIMPRLALAVAGMATGLVGGVVLSGSVDFLRPGRETTSLVSDCDGRLEAISFHYVRSFHDDSIETISDFLGQLPAEVSVTVVVGAKGEFDFLVQDLARRGIRRPGMKALVTNAPITPWAKDRFGTMRTASGGAVLAVSPTRSLASGSRATDEKVPEWMARELPDITCRALPFFFEGGDFLSDSTNAYVAGSLLARNQPWDKTNTKGLLETIGVVLWRQVVTIGLDAGAVPDHHVGMYLTPLGDSTIAVGDPELGRDLYQRYGDGAPIDVETNDKMYLPFKHAMEEVVRRGLRVVRVPLVLTCRPRVYMTYNNALLEVRSGVKRIYMPVYGVPGLDDRARRIYEAEGWTVLPVRVAKLYGHTGSLRCLVGVVRRGD